MGVWWGDGGGVMGWGGMRWGDGGGVMEVGVVFYFL